MRRIQKWTALLLALLCTVGLTGAAMAVEPVNYGNMETVDFPDVYPEDKIEDITSAEVDAKVEALLKSMTYQELLSMLGGNSAANTKSYGSGYVNGVPRLGVPVLRMYDGPKNTVSNDGMDTTAPATQLALAASWDNELAYEYGSMAGRENRSSGGNVLLGTQMDIIRTGFYQRGRDDLGEDPYLASELGAIMASGVQDQHVTAVLKHFAAYMNQFTMSDDIYTVDEQTLHELYFPTFKKAIQEGGAMGVMTAYIGVNGVRCSSNTYLQLTVLRDMWGFRGATMTDWGGGAELDTHLGDDLEMSDIIKNNQEAIEAAIADGVMTLDDVYEAVRHTLTMYGEMGYLGLVKIRQDGTAASDPEPPECIELPAVFGDDRLEMLEEDNELALRTALEGAVLLKNESGALPLASDETIGVVGLTGAYVIPGHRTESSFGWLGGMVSPYEALSDALGADNVTLEVGLDATGVRVPAEYLYQDEACTKNGVVYEKTLADGTTEAGVLEDLFVSTGTIDGKPNRTYVNSEDGVALSLGESASYTTYLTVPETGVYEFKTLGIAGKLGVVITDDAGAVTALTSSYNWFMGTTSDEMTFGAIPNGGFVCTYTGMNIPDAVTAVELEAGKVYRVDVTAEATSQFKDMQFSLNWYAPDQRQQEYDAAVALVDDVDTVVYFAFDIATGGDYSDFFLNSNYVHYTMPEDQAALLHDICAAAEAQGKKVIVVLNTGLPMKVNDEDWDAVDAIVEMWLPGQAGGTATAQLLTGEVNFSGKLPVTFPATENDTQLGAYADISYEVAKDVKEGIYTGYRWHDHIDDAEAGIPNDTVLFDFGYGLSYTTFAYSDMSCVPSEDGGYDVTLTITNTGEVPGADIAQVYIGAAEAPDYVQMAEIQLAGYCRTEELAPGESVTVTIHVSEASLSYWDVNADVEEGQEKWVAAPDRAIYVGSSSDSLTQVFGASSQGSAEASGEAGGTASGEASGGASGGASAS